MFLSFATIVLLATFGRMQALDYVDMNREDRRYRDNDEAHELAWRCTWYIFCDLDHTMEAKTIMDALDNRTMIVFADKIRALAPFRNITNEELYDNEFWKKYANKIACSVSDEDKKKLKELPVIEYSSEVCDENWEDEEECKKLAISVELTHAMLLKYKEECLEEELKQHPGIKK
ncbi:unnamed protein product [Larinioides sclopetarius]|uniref:Uncharacterized protein n=1 Tax=Larinioides sclopetarius TaxID=280406 RepID=A0AAV2B2P1_9ARAC